MSLVAGVSGVLIIAVGALGVVSPPRLLALVARSQSQRGLYVLAAIRVIIGAALFLAAAGSRAPALLHILGVISVVAGVATPFFGVHRFQAVLGWWSLRPAVVLRLWCLIVVLLGAAIVWAVAP
jgi:hypothetical protein